MGKPATPPFCIRPLPLGRWQIEQALEPFDCLPWATMSGIGGWSFGNQSAGPKRALIWATVNDNGLPSSVRGVFAGSTGSLPATADLMKRDHDAAHVEVRVSGEAPPIDADPDMLKMVFQNLLINSSHALEGRGRIDVRVGMSGGAATIAVSSAPFTEIG